MELDLPTPVSRPPSLYGAHTLHGIPTTQRCLPPSTPLRGKAPLSGGYAAHCAGAFQGKEGGIQVLAGLAPYSQTVRSLFRVIHEQAKLSSWTTEVNIIFVTWQQSSLSLSLSLSLSIFLSPSLSLLGLLGTNVVRANVASRKCHSTKIGL